MNGELILKGNSPWKKILPTVLLTTLLTFLLILPMMLRLKVTGLMAAAMVAILTYVLWRLLYPLMSRLLPEGEKNRRLPWRLDGEALYLGEENIPLENLKMVHCWPNRDALGNRLPGWTVNLETKGKQKNQVFRSLEEGEELTASVESLHTLVEALGYGSLWVEET